MKDLIILKGAVITIIQRLQEDTRDSIKLAISNLFVNPLVNFNDAYDEFVGSIGQSAEASDRWRNIQIDLITEVGEEWEILFSRFKQVYQTVMKESPGGEIFTFHKSEWDTVSLSVALMIRVYGDTLYLVDEAKTQ